MSPHTKYYLFDDACEPVGLTAERKEDWERISQDEFAQRTPRAAQATTDLTVEYWNHVLLTRAMKGV